VLVTVISVEERLMLTMSWPKGRTIIFIISLALGVVPNFQEHSLSIKDNLIANPALEIFFLARDVTEVLPDSTSFKTASLTTRIAQNNGSVLSVEEMSQIL